MEKFSQFRDRGSGISPFLPTTTPTSLLSTLTSTILFALRLPFFLAYTTLFFLLLQLLPLPGVLRKLLLWLYLAIPGIWWVDLQLDGVKRGSLSQQPPNRVPHPGSVIAANFTSPIDPLYLAAVFDPIFVATYPNSRKVRKISLLSAILSALRPSPLSPPLSEGLTDIRTLLKEYPERVIAIFPECGTTNGKGILPPSPSLLTVPVDAQIFPVSLRYTPPDITTPVPGTWARFVWRLLGRPTHCIRVRIAEGMRNTTQAVNGVPSHDESIYRSGGEDGITAEEQQLLDGVAEALARLGRAKRVGLTLKDKKAFVEAWNKRRR